MSSESGSKEVASTDELAKMDLCLKNIHKMRQNESDLSDYHMFIESVSSFLKISQNHDIYVKSLLYTINKCKNHRFLSILYELCSLLKVKEFFIKKSILKLHFKVRSCRPSIIKCVNAFGLGFLDLKIKKCFLRNRDFVFPSMFEFISRRHPLFVDFMYIRDRNYIYKQLEVMINCNIIENLPYFAGFLGCESKIIAFKAFEALNVIFQTLENSPGHQKQANCLQHEGGLFIELNKDNLVIENPVHFISCGFEFLRERSAIIECVSGKCTREALNTLNSLLCKYGHHRPISRDEFSKIALCYRKEVVLIEKKNMPIENFDFLFYKKSRKDFCDCYEF